MSKLEEKNMKILVTTPTGNIGRRVLVELLAPEFSVRVISRDPSRLPEEIREQVEVVRGSTDETATLRRALDGVEALFWCVPSASLDTMNVREHYERFAHAACQAIREARTSRIVTISAGGKRLAGNAGPISGLHTMEDILNQSGAAIRHLRCSWFMENFLRQAQQVCERGIFSFPMPGHVALPMAAATDIADVALRWLVRRNWKGIDAVSIHGPQDLSFNQAAEIFECVLERPVRYTQLAADDFVRNMVRSGASVHYANRLAAMFSQLAVGISRAEPRTPESTTPTTVMAWAERELLPFIEPLGHEAEEAMSPSTC